MFYGNGRVLVHSYNFRCRTNAEPAVRIGFVFAQQVLDGFRVTYQHNFTVKFFYSLYRSKHKFFRAIVRSHYIKRDFHMPVSSFRPGRVQL